MEPIEIVIKVVVINDGRVLVSQVDNGNASPLGMAEDGPIPDIKSTVIFTCRRFHKNGNQCCEKVKCRMRGKYKGEPIEIKAGDA